jgi:hypothetical protein
MSPAAPPPNALEALAHGQEIRMARAQLKREVKAGRSVVEVLSEPIPDWLENMPVHQLLDAVPRLRKTVIGRMLEETGNMSWTRNVGEITTRQKSILAELITAWEQKQQKSGRRARTKFERGVR